MSSCCEPPAFEPPAGPQVPGKFRTVALIGPPNSGKSTLFNRLTGLRQKVANYPGVTVEQRMGVMAGVGRDDLTLIDLPGIYSLTPYSEDARVAVEVLAGTMHGTPKPDAVLLVLDSQHLTRQLMLAAPILATGLPTLVLLNMTDLMEQRGGKVDSLQLARELSAPVAQISAVHGTGLNAINLFLNQPGNGTGSHPSLTLPVIGNAASAHTWAAQVSRRTGYRAPLSVEGTQKIDSVLLHRIWGPLLFLAVVIGVFEVVFSIGQPLSDGFGDILARMGDIVRPLLPIGWLQSLVLDGVWKGISSVLVFLPQILLLFLFIGILEDSGYLARAALIADRVMRTIGLNGKAFIPLLSAYACAVPAIMATRTIASRRDRLTTILVAPFMTCSARLPLYTMIIAAFIPDRPVIGEFLGLRACAMMGLYGLGMVAALITSRLLHMSLLRKDDSSFAIELPEYRMPLWHSLGINLLDRARIFVKQVGTVILVTSLIVWILANFPVHHGQLSPIGDSYLGSVGNAIEPALRPLGLDRNVGVALLTAFAARETVVSTLGTLYRTPQIGVALRGSIGLAGALSLLVFFALAMQCTSTLATVRRETNSWRWPLFQLVYMSTIAYTAAWATFHLSLWLL